MYEYVHRCLTLRVCPPLFDITVPASQAVPHYGSRFTGGATLRFPLHRRCHITVYCEVCQYTLSKSAIRPKDLRHI